jgi:hypothetical protein
MFLAYGALPAMRIMPFVSGRNALEVFRVPKKMPGPKARRSQTGRLHVWETWDHEDPEFRTRSAKAIRAENLP